MNTQEMTDQAHVLMGLGIRYSSAPCEHEADADGAGDGADGVEGVDEAGLHAAPHWAKVLYVLTRLPCALAMTRCVRTYS